MGLLRVIAPRTMTKSSFTISLWRNDALLTALVNLFVANEPYIYPMSDLLHRFPKSGVSLKLSEIRLEF